MPITKRTNPTFALTQTTAVDIKRRGKGGIVKGRPTEAEELEIVIEANVQPLQYKDTMMLPESDRTKEWIRLYTVSPIRAAKEGENGHEADIVVWQGLEYKVMKTQQWVMGTLDHFKALAARVPISAKGL